MDTRASLDRAFEWGWLLYPAALFTLPNSLKIGGLVAPETLLGAIYFLIFSISIVVFRRPAAPVEIMQEFPFAWISFAGLCFIAVALRGDGPATLHAATWVMVSLITREVLSDSVVRGGLWWLLAISAFGTSVYAFAILPLPFPEEVNILAWVHRTGLGYFLAMGLLSSLYLSSTRRGLKRIVAFAIAVTIAGALVATLARGAWIGATAGIFVMYARRPGRRAWIAAAGIAAGVALAMHVSSSEIIAARIRTLVDIQSASSSLYRLNMYLATWRSLPDTWLLGADTLQLGPFLARYSLVRYPHYYAPGFATDSDVIYLVLLGGVPLLLAFVWLALYIAKRMWTAPRIGDAPLMAAIACTAAMQMLFDNSLSSALGWFLLGLLSCPHSRSRRVTMRVAATV